MYGSGSRSGIAQVALGVVRVVQPIVADGRARDGRVEDVRSLQDRERRQLAPEGPTADRHPRGVEERPPLGRRGEPVGLVVQRDGEVEMDRPLPRHAPPVHAAPVDRQHRDAEPIREVLLRPVGAAPPDDRLHVRAAVRAQQHRQRDVRLVAAREEQRGREVAGTEQRVPRPCVHDRFLGVGGQNVRTVAAHDGRLGMLRVGAEGPKRDRAAGHDGVREARLRIQPLRRRAALDPVDVGLEGIAVGRGEPRAGAARPEHLLHMQPRRRDGLGAEPYASGVVGIDRAHERAVVEPVRRTADELDPDVVAILEDDRGGAGCRIDLPDLGRPLVARLHEDRERRPIRPLHARQVLEGLAIPVDLDVRAGRDVHDPQPYVRVRGPGLRVPHGARGVGGIRRLREPPGPDRALVDAARGDARAVRRPPVASVAPHLLGRDELRQSERHVRVVVGRERPLGAVEITNEQRPVHDVGDRRSVGREPRVVRDTRRRDLHQVARSEVHDLQAPAPRRSTPSWRSCRPRTP